MPEAQIASTFERGNEIADVVTYEQPRTQEPSLAHDTHLGTEAHICTANCQHSKDQADKFANDLFNDMPSLAHGETGHVCNANCQHTQAEADNFAKDLFADTKLEVAHVCTADCEHSQQKADAFAEKLFSEVSSSADHGETGHVCNANCQHTQAEADNFAKDLFAESIGSTVEISQGPETAMATTSSGNSKDYAGEPAPVQPKPVANISSVVSKYNKVLRNVKSFKKKPEVIKINKVTETVLAEQENIEAPVELQAEVDINSLEQQVAESNPDIEKPALEATDGYKLIFDEKLEDDIEIISINNNEIGTDIFDSIDLPTEEFQDYEIPPNEAVETEGIFMKMQIATEENPEYIISIEASVDKTLIDTPALQPLEESLPKLIEILRSPENEKSLQFSKAITNIIEASERYSRATIELSKEQQDAFTKNIEVIAENLGIGTQELLKLLGVKSGDIMLSQRGLEILLGLQKLISTKSAEDVPKYKNTTPNSSAIIQQLGELVMGILHTPKLRSPLLGA